MAAHMTHFNFGRSVVRTVADLFSLDRTLSSVNAIKSLRCFNSNRNSLTRIARTTYVRVYPTLLVQPDGSTIRIRYSVPQKIIKLPIDVSKLTEEDRKMHADKHKTKEKVVIAEEIDDDFNIDDYSHLWKNLSNTK